MQDAKPAEVRARGWAGCIDAQAAQTVADVPGVCVIRREVKRIVFVPRATRAWMPTHASSS